MPYNRTLTPQGVAIFRSKLRAEAEFIMEKGLEQVGSSTVSRSEIRRRGELMKGALTEVAIAWMQTAEHAHPRVDPRQFYLGSAPFHRQLLAAVRELHEWRAVESPVEMHSMSDRGDAGWTLDGAWFAITAVRHLMSVTVPGIPPALPADIYPVMAEMACYEAGSPLWVLSSECTEAMVRTEPLPEEEVIGLITAGHLRLPFPALYISVPHGLLVSGDTQVAGLYLVERTLHDGDSAMMVVARSRCGEDYAFTNSWGVLSRPLADRRWHAAPDDSLWRFVFNFLAALRGDYLITSTRRPKVPKNPHKLQKMQRRGEPTEHYVQVDLRERTRNESREAPEGERGGSHASPRTHWVRGHWRNYWVMHPGEAPSYGTRLREDGVELHRVLRWLQPFLRGNADETPAAPKYMSL